MSTQQHRNDAVSQATVCMQTLGLLYVWWPQLVEPRTGPTSFSAGLFSLFPNQFPVYVKRQHTAFTDFHK